MKERAHPHWSSEEYQKLAGFESEWRDYWWRLDYLALVAHRWEMTSAQSLLDIGCGYGHWGMLWLKLLDPKLRLTGIEQDPQFVEHARQRAQQKEIADRCHFEAGKAEALPYDDGSFDLVTCQTVLMHLPRPELALAEMKRVVKPGGLVFVAEPDNMAGVLAMLNGDPHTDWPTAQGLLDFRHRCERGKQALGEGNSSIGGLLPKLFHECGFSDIDASSNDRVPFLLPPYETHREQSELEHWRGWTDADIVGYVGDKSNARRCYLAGGGDEAGFEQAWGLALEHQKRWMQQIEKGSFCAARGFLHYLVCGRKV